MNSHSRTILPLTIALLATTSQPLLAQKSEQGDFLKLQREIDPEDGWQRWGAFSPDGKSVASCGDRLVQMYDVKTGRRVRQFRGSSDLKRLAFSPEGK